MSSLCVCDVVGELSDLSRNASQRCVCPIISVCIIQADVQFSTIYLIIKYRHSYLFATVSFVQVVFFFNSRIFLSL